MCVPNAWRPFSAARHSKRTAWHPFRYWMRWEWHWSTGNVGISTANWFSIQKLLWITHTIYFIVQIMYSARKFQYSVLILEEFSSCHRIECGTLNFLNSSISVRLLWWASRNSCHSCPWRSRCSSSARAAWNLCWSILAWHSARICSFCLSSRVLICASWLLCSAGRPALSPSGRPVLSDTDDDDRLTDKSSRWEWWLCTRWASRSIPSSAASSCSASAGNTLSEKNGGESRSSV